MKHDTPVRNTLTVLAAVPVLLYMAAKTLLKLTFGAVAFVAVLVGTLALGALGIGFQLALVTAVGTGLIAAGNYALHLAFGVTMLSALKLTALGFVSALVLPLLKRSR